MSRSRWVIVLVVGLVACGDEGERVGQVALPLDAPLAEAYCDAMVDGLGTIPTETDYLPQVIACENGGADLEALKAQAVAARSVLYWTQGTNGSICDSQGCQVYTCNQAVLPIHQQAVEETSGKYLAYNGNVTYGFYVNGDRDTAPPECIGDPNAQNEHWLTYNEGLTGTQVESTELGFVHMPGDSGYGQNRGCQGQWGARCLEEVGYDYEQILQFYYGADIEVIQAPGPCVIPDEPGSGGGGGAVVAVAASSVASGTSTGVGGGGAGAGGDALPVESNEVDTAGCSCRSAGSPLPRRFTWGWLAVIGALGWRRRRSAADGG